MKKMMFVLICFFIQNQNLMCMDGVISCKKPIAPIGRLYTVSEDSKPVGLHAQLLKAIKKDPIKKVTKIISQHPSIVNTYGECPLYGNMIPPLLYIPRIEIWDGGDVLHALLKAGAYPNATDNQGNTFLHVPAEHIDKRHLKYLLKYGIDIDKQNQLGRTPLMQYIRADHFMAKKIMKFSANINAQDNDGKTALHHAYQMRAFEIADLIWGDTDIDEDIIDNKGRKAIDMIDCPEDQEMKDVSIQASNFIKEVRKSDVFEFSYCYLSKLLDKQMRTYNYDELHAIHIQLKAMPMEDFLRELERFDDYEKSIFCSLRNGRNLAFIIKKEKQRRKRERMLAINEFITPLEEDNGMSKVE